MMHGMCLTGLATNEGHSDQVIERKPETVLLDHSQSTYKQPMQLTGCTTSDQARWQLEMQQ